MLWAPPTSTAHANVNTARLAHSSAEHNAVPSGPFNGVAAPRRRNRTNNHPRPRGFTQAAPALAMSMLTPATSIVFHIHFLPYAVNYLFQIDLKYFSLHFIESIHSPWDSRSHYHSLPTSSEQNRSFWPSAPTSPPFLALNSWCCFWRSNLATT